ncbi:MAG: hypothetical protein AAGK14_01965 [Verrucomicrobiota bacterium]
MTTLAEIEKAIEQLPPEDYAKLVAWLKARPLPATLDEDKLDEIQEQIFRAHAPLLKKLAE